MLGIAGAAAETTAHANAGVDLKPLFTPRMNQFHRAGSLPVPPILPGVGVNPRASEEIIEVHDNRIARKGLHVIDDGVTISWIIDHGGIHAIIHRIGSPSGGPTSRGAAIRGLPNDILKK